MRIKKLVPSCINDIRRISPPPSQTPPPPSAQPFQLLDLLLETRNPAPNASPFPSYRTKASDHSTYGSSTLFSRAFLTALDRSCDAMKDLSPSFSRYRIGLWVCAHRRQTSPSQLQPYGHDVTHSLGSPREPLEGRKNSSPALLVCSATPIRI
jgi:hypothetical protein